MDFQEWGRQFWMALKPDGDGGWTERGHTFEGGKMVLETVGVVEKHGVILRWQSAERGIVALRQDPFGAPTERLEGEQTPVTVQGDPITTASFIRKRLSALV